MLDLDANERAELLDRVGARDADLRGQLEMLLAAAHESSRNLLFPAVADRDRKDGSRSAFH